MTQEETKLDKWYTASRDRVFKAVSKKNMDLNLIAEITNLPVEEIKTLK